MKVLCELYRDEDVLSEMYMKEKRAIQLKIRSILMLEY